MRRSWVDVVNQHSDGLLAERSSDATSYRKINQLVIPFNQPERIVARMDRGQL
jgi:hypothetical protein